MVLVSWTLWLPEIGSEIDACSGHAFRKNTAGAFGPDLARKLSQLVKMEKNVMRSMELVSRERMETAVRKLIVYAMNADEI